MNTCYQQDTFQGWYNVVAGPRTCALKKRLEHRMHYPSAEICGFSPGQYILSQRGLEPPSGVDCGGDG